MERRDFLKLVGITGAGAATACDQKIGPRSLIPYLVPAEDITPGVPTWYASTCRECPAGCGVHVKTREGRVIKLEGNPDNPVNRGKLCARGQTAHQHLYDPDRLRGPRALSGDDFSDIDWDAGIRQLAEAVGSEQRGDVVLMTGFMTGTRARLYDAWSEAHGARRVVYEPFAHEAVVEANRRVFGVAAVPDYDVGSAEFVISFGADFLETFISPVRYSRGFSEMHTFREGSGGGVFVAVEPRLSMTASNADEWVSAKPGSEHLVALGMANVLGAGGDAAPWTPERVTAATGVPAGTIERLAHAFGASRSLAIPGGVSAAHNRATAACVAVNLLNQVGGAVGDTVHLDRHVNGAVPHAFDAVRELSGSMRAGDVRVILFAETNPLFSLPPALGFAEALESVLFRASFSSVFDETSAHCTLLLPDHTPLESWGDWEPESGVKSIQQPAMRPLFDTRATPDVLLTVHRELAGESADAEPAGPAATLLAADGWYEALREAWLDRAPDDVAWAVVLSDGGDWSGAANGAETDTDAAGTVGASQSLDFSPATFEGDGLELIVFPQIAMYDGRTANRPWLQELPDPATTVSWQSWVEVHPETAAGLGIADGDVVRVSSPHGAVEAPVIVYPGIRAGAVAMPLGRGHTSMGRFAVNGVNPVELLPAVAEEASGGFVYQAVKVTLSPTGAWVPPLKHQGSDSQEGRGIGQGVPMAVALGEAEAEAHHGVEHGEPLTVERVVKDSLRETPYRWGMTIDVDACTGCGACVAACSAENNIAFVGPERIERSRQMQWIRIERYLEPKTDGTLETRHVPMMCQHCGAAPCEPVCPVYATYHNAEGLNVQVYNRCVGTRYCSNNCPYKVRYFNWFTYEWPEPLNLALNPDVTTRETGVMEKCTMCVQRINAAKMAVKDKGPDAVIADGSLQTACQQTCPSEAIVFGNLKDPGSKVAQMAHSSRAYSVLEVLNTRPANFYLKQVNGRSGAETLDSRAARAADPHGEPTAEPGGAGTEH